MSQTSRFAVDQGWQILLKDLSISPVEFLKRARLPGDMFARKDFRLPADDYFRMWETLEAIFSDPAFPLRLIDGMTADFFSPSIFAAYCSPNFEVALERLRQFKPLIGPMRLDINKTKTRTSMTIAFKGIKSPVPASLVATELAFFVKLARMGTRENIRPLAVISPVELVGQDTYTEFFGITPRQGKKICLKFAANDMKLPFVTENEQMWEFFEPVLRKKLSDLKSDENYSSRVRSTLLELLPSGRTSVDDVAQTLAISRRTLQRRLNEEQTNYQSLLNTVREELARYYLTNSALPSSQISFLLGFDDPNSFFRAFHSWTGTTPERIRGKSFN